MTASRTMGVLAWLVAALLAWPTAVVAQADAEPTAQDPPPAAETSEPAEENLGPPPAGDLTVEAVETLEAEIPEDLDEATRLSITDYCDRAITALRDAAKALERTSASERQRLAAPGNLETIQAELDQPAIATAVLPPEVPEDADTSVMLEASRQRAQELDLLATQVDASLQAAQQKLDEVKTEQIRRGTRIVAIPAETAQLTLQLEELQALLAAPAPPDELPRLTAARRAEREARQQRLVAEIGAAESERLHYDEGSHLLAAQEARWKRRIAGYEQEVATLREAVNRQAQQSNQLQQMANEEMRRRLAASVPPLVAVLDDINRLNTLQGKVLPELESTMKEEEKLSGELTTVLDRYQTALDRAHTHTLIDTTDVRLRRHRSELPDVARLARAVKTRRGTISAVQVALDDLKIDEDNLPPLSVQRDKIMASLTEEQAAMLQQDISHSLEQQRSLYLSLARSYELYLDELLDVQIVQRQLALVTDAYLEFINARILWLRSADDFSFRDFPLAWKTFLDWLPFGEGDDRGVSGPQRWHRIGDDIRSRFRSRPIRAVIGVVLVLALIGTMPLMRRRIIVVGERVQRVVADRMRYTWETLWLTLLRALGWAAIPLAIAWFLSPEEAVFESTAMLKNGFGRMGYGIFSIMLLREICLEGGLGQAHFHWRTQTCRVLRRATLWLVLLDAPLLMVTATLESHIGVPGKTALGRLAFMLSTIPLAFFAYRVLRPRGGILEKWLTEHPGGWVDRLRWAWFWGVVATLPTLTIMAAEGYYYTAIQIQRSVGTTYWLILIVTVVNGLSLRAFLQAKRRLILEEMRQRREQAAEETDGGDEGRSVPVEETGLGLEQIDAHTRKLAQTAIAFVIFIGLWLIWTQTFPALSSLQRVQVWPRVGIAIQATESTVPPELRTGQLRIQKGPVANDADGGQPAEPAEDASTATSGAPPTNIMLRGITGGMAGGPEVAPASTPEGVVTLADLFMCIVLVIGTIIVSRNLPGVLEITILSKLPLEASARYAISTIVQYIVVIVGIVAAFSSINIGWSKIQWLAAAISVGLGFGLQEIVANFISGIIVLFEQPVRVGDTVTIGTVSGTVTRIQMRATTIMGWDRKELVVPNKEFVVGQIVNWSLSDATLRVTIPVNVRYGSDTEQAKRIMREIAEAHPHVVEDPSPMAIAVGFGENAIKLELRVWLPNMDNFLSTRDALLDEIIRRFSESGVRIAFPQLDLHVRTAGGDEIALPGGVTVKQEAPPPPPAADE